MPGSGENKMETITLNDVALECAICKVAFFVRPFLRKNEQEMQYSGVSLALKSLFVLGNYKQNKPKSIEERMAEFMESPKKKTKQ